MAFLKIIKRGNEKTSHTYAIFIAINIFVIYTWLKNCNYYRTKFHASNIQYQSDYNLIVIAIVSLIA